MKPITIGGAEGFDVSLDLLKLVDTRLLVQANSGGGKSWFLRLLAERAGDKLQTIVIDNEGEFATLREKLDMVLVASDGDVAPQPRAAALLARRLIETKVSAVVDLYELKLPESKTQRGTVPTISNAKRKLFGRCTESRSSNHDLQAL